MASCMVTPIIEDLILEHAKDNGSSGGTINFNESHNYEDPNSNVSN